MTGDNVLNHTATHLKHSYASVRLFKSYLKFQKYYEDVIKRFDSEYVSHMSEMNSQTEGCIRNGWMSYTPAQLYGDPVPLNLEDAIKREQFQNMPLFKQRYDELYPFMLGLSKKSEAIIEKPKMIFTDREIGMFSLQRFMMGAQPEMGFYSKKQKKFIDIKPVLYSKKHKKIVERKDVFGGGERDNYKYFLKEDKSEVYDTPNIVFSDSGKGATYTLLKDGSEIEYRQLVDKGVDVFGTSNKKVFFVKQLVKREYKSIRIFVAIGNAWGQDTVNTGICTVALVVFLESLGYSVRLTGVKCQRYEYGRKDHLNPNGGFIGGYRTSVFDLKGYADTMDALTMLYAVADPSCFRVKFFRYIIAEQFDYSDQYDAGLGYPPSIGEVKDLIINMMKARDIDFERNALYYFIGGKEINSIEDGKAQIEKIVLDSEDENRAALLGIPLEEYRKQKELRESQKNQWKKQVA